MHLNFLEPQTSTESTDNKCESEATAAEEEPATAEEPSAATEAPAATSTTSSSSISNFTCYGNRWFNQTQSSGNRIVYGDSGNHLPFIINLSIGRKAQSVLRTSSSSTSHCVGSILTDRFILTAGRCCAGSDPSEMSIYAGSNNFYDGHHYELVLQEIQFLSSCFQSC